MNIWRTWTVGMMLAIALSLLFLKNSNSQNATPPPASSSTPMAIGLSPVGQKTFENIQLRFQLLQRDVADLERNELAQHPEINPKDYRLDASRGVLIRATPLPAAPKPNPPAAAKPAVPPAPAPKPEVKK
jgi:hypothetical protein